MKFKGVEEEQLRYIYFMSKDTIKRHTLYLFLALSRAAIS